GRDAWRCASVDRSTEGVVLVAHRRAVPSDVGLVDRDRLEHLDMIAEQREVGKHVDVDWLRRRKVEDFFRLGAEAVAQRLGVMLAARRRAFPPPPTARALSYARLLSLYP